MRVLPVNQASNISAKVRISINVGDKIAFKLKDTTFTKGFGRIERVMTVISVDKNKIVCLHEKGFVETFSKTDVVNMFKKKTMWKVEENE